MYYRRIGYTKNNISFCNMKGFRVEHEKNMLQFRSCFNTERTAIPENVHHEMLCLRCVSAYYVSAVQFYVIN